MTKALILITLCLFMGGCVFNQSDYSEFEPIGNGFGMVLVSSFGAAGSSGALELHFRDQTGKETTLCKSLMDYRIKDDKMIYTASLPEIPKYQQLQGYPGEIHAISVTHLFFVRGPEPPIDISEKFLAFLANDYKIDIAKNILEAECGFLLSMHGERIDEKGPTVRYSTDVASVVPGGLKAIIEWNAIPAIITTEVKHNTD